MSVPTVMRWDHKNAPQIADMGNWTQIKAWYQAIFVDGYLADDDTTLIPPLGWDVTFNDGSYYVYLTQDTGADTNIWNRMYMVVQYNGVVTSHYYGDQVDVYNNNGGIKITGFGASSYHGAPTWYGNNTHGSNRHCPWIVIGNNRGVYFLGGYNPSTTTSEATHPQFSTSNTWSTWQYFGDFVNDGVDYGRNNQCCTYGREENINNDTKYYATYVRNSADWEDISRLSKAMVADQDDRYCGIHVTHDEDGNTRGTNFTATPFGLGYGTNYPGRTGLYDLPYPYIDGSLKIIEFDLWIRNNQSTPVNNERNQVYIGKMPGLYFPMHFSPLYNNNSLVEFEGSGEFEGKHFIGLARASADEFYINITDDWGI